MTATGYSCRRAAIVAAGILATAAVVATVRPASADEGQGVADSAVESAVWSPGWKSLHYRAGNFLGRFRAELDVMPAGGPPAAAGDLAPGGWIAELRTGLRSFLFRNKTTRVRAWFDPSTGAVSRMTKLSSGSKPSFKEYAFLSDGVRRRRVAPAEGEADLSPDTWSEVGEAFYQYQTADYGCRVVSDPGALIALLGQAGVTDSTDGPACVFSGKTLYRLDITLAGHAPHRVRHRILSATGSKRRRGKVDAAHLEVAAIPVAGDLEGGPGRFDVFVDTATHIPVRVVAREGPFRINVVLDRVVIAGDETVARGSVDTRPAVSEPVDRGSS